MRIILALPFLLAAACTVENDEANDQVTLDFNQQQVEDTAADAVNAAEDVAGDVGNAASSAGAAIENEVGDIDVDIDTDGNESGNSN